MRRGMLSRERIAVAATASGGDTIAPKTKAAAQGTSGISALSAARTTSVVASTRPMASSEMVRRFALKPRHEVSSAATLVVGAALKALIPEIPWAAAFVFGAIVSPPDAVAATAILSRLNMPRRIVTVLEGESLVNDASGLVLYKFAVAAVLSGTFSLADASTEFVLISAGGIAAGMLLGGLFVLLHRYLGDPFIEGLLSLSVPYMAYVLAESVGASGVLAVVAARALPRRHSPP